MEFPERVSAKLTKAIAENVDGFSEDKLAEINYGIAVFITNGYKNALLFVLALVLGVLKYFLIAFFCFGILRTFAAGIHAKREWTCLPTSLAIYFGIIYVAIYLQFNITVTTLIFCFCFIIMLLYAPADTEEKPIASKSRRVKLKLLSCIATIVLYLVSIHYIGTTISHIITLSAVVECVLIMPVSYKLTGNTYDNGIKINTRGTGYDEKSIETHSGTY